MTSAANWLCTQSLREHVQTQLTDFPRRVADPTGLRRAAVAMVLTDLGHGADVGELPVFAQWQGDAALLLTRRVSTMRHHAGQWALPGGRCDDGETPAQTALRELHEEVDVKLPDDAVLGLLDDFVTRSGFIMTPVVVWGGPRLDASPSPSEVASIHRIPFTEFARPDAPVLEDIPESSRPVLRMPVGDTWIAAPTAALLYQLTELIIPGRVTRVAHFEQPVFAWK